MSSRFEIHSHTHYSNIRLVDSINRPETLIDRAIEIGLKGIAITEHEWLGGAVCVNKYTKKIKEKNPDFKIAIGNEIYLTETREKNQKYPHFILIAKDAIGFRQLKELSSKSWMQSYYDRGMERVPTTRTELEEIISKNPGHIIASTACLAGTVNSSILEMELARKVGDMDCAAAAYNKINTFIDWCKDLFGNDFYLEVAPAANREQIIVNKKVIEISKVKDLKVVIGSDAHYLKKEDRYVHKAFLNSKNGEREVDDFYEYAYLQTEDEIIENLTPSIVDAYEWMCQNSMEIYDKIEFYDLFHKQSVTRVPLDKKYGKNEQHIPSCYPTLNKLSNSDDEYDRYWVNQCLEKLRAKNLYNTTYLNRLEEEADIKDCVGKALDTNVFAYPIMLQHYINLFWECGSTVGAGRGSSCAGLNHYLLGVTQLDPIKWELPFFRYLNKERLDELPDIDLDLCPSKKPDIIKKIKAERSEYLDPSLDELSRNNLGCVLVATYGTMTSKSAVLCACRGYRSVDYQDGIDTDTAQFLSSLIPTERGFVWSLSDVLYGNEEEGREPVALFKKEIEQYPGLLDIILGVEGLIDKRSSHASGVIITENNPYDMFCFARTPRGEVITAYDLHDAEYVGGVKIDLLVTAVQDKIVQTINFLKNDNLIDKNLSLREIYNKYLHPDVLPINKEEYWDALDEGKVLQCFQFDTEVGSQGIKKIQPRSILEMTDTNALIRLMNTDDSNETPMEKYSKFKNNIDLWYQECNRYGLTKEEIKNLEPYFLPCHGVVNSQETMMLLLMDKNICNFSLKEANAARKIVAKKKMKEVPALREKILNAVTSHNLGEYLWKAALAPQMSYSFAKIHGLAYSFIGFQTVYLAVAFPSIYWNCSCLVVDSGSLEDDSNSFEEDEDGDIVGPAQDKEDSTDYAKIAIALNAILKQNIKIALIDINKSSYGFKPDAANNQILFGMKALNGVGAPIIEKIIENRPYYGIKDFMKKCPLNKTAMISLIKSGAFDNLESKTAEKMNLDPRILVMAYYLSVASEPKSKLNLMNFNGLIEKNLIPDELKFEKDTFILNKLLKKNKRGSAYLIPSGFDINKLTEAFGDIFTIQGDNIFVGQKEWDSIYKTVMDKPRQWLKDNQTETLKKYNQLLFNEIWDKYAKGNISYWEMESLCFYYHGHELKDVNNQKYGIVNFDDLSTTPVVEKTFKRNGKQIPLYELSRIAGTVISKNDSRHSISLLTTTGVVNVKFTKDYYALFGRQISEVQPDGTKKVKEKGWFVRGTKLLITGYRRDNTFVSKTYKSTGLHQLYKINAIEGSNLIITHNRWGQKNEEE